MKVYFQEDTPHAHYRCVEIAAAGQRLILDPCLPAGAMTTARAIADCASLPIGVLSANPGPTLLTVLATLNVDVPLLIGPGAHAVLEHAAEWHGKSRISRRPVVWWRHRMPVRIGPFIVTPFLADHSANDSFDLLIEAEGRRLFYCGNIRHLGRNPVLFEALLRYPPTDVDVLLIDGHRLPPNHAATHSEVDAEIAYLRCLRRAEGLSLIWMPSLDVDRLITVCRAVRRSNKRLIMDAYTAELLRVTGEHSLTCGMLGSEAVIHVPRRLLAWRHAVARRGFTTRCVAFGQVSALRENVVLLNPSMLGELDELEPAPGMQILRSALGCRHVDPVSHVVGTWIARRSIPVHEVPSPALPLAGELNRLVAALAPRRLICRHTGCRACQAPAFVGAERRPAGEWWSV